MVMMILGQVLTRLAQTEEEPQKEPHCINQKEKERLYMSEKVNHQIVDFITLKHLNKGEKKHIKDL